MTTEKPRLMIAGTGSGCGKTTVTCGLLKALVDRGIQTASFKCGPDYIDPMFHSQMLGVCSRNLDIFLCGEEAVSDLLAKNAGEISVMEGVMGFYDGLETDYASSHHLSQITQTPVVLVVGVKGKALSLAAEINGFCDFMPNQIKGVILNGASAATYPMYQKIIENYTKVKAYGYLPNLPDAAIESRHLGLVTASEITNLQQKLTALGSATAATVDVDALIALSQTAPPLRYTPIDVPFVGSCRIGVAKDHAFCFYYQDNLDLLTQMGAELVPFSPLTDHALPDHLDGLLFGGGYPELYTQTLSQNTSFLESVRRAAQTGIPIYAECGGFMYLQQSIDNLPMVGILSGDAHMTHKLTRFGYVTLTAQEDNLLCSRGEQINAHEFHYSDSDQNGSAFLASKPTSSRSWLCMQSTKTCIAGYPHLHFYGNRGMAEQFVRACAAPSRKDNT